MCNMLYTVLCVEAFIIGMRQVLGAGALGRPRMGWGTHVNPWLIHVNVWQKPLQYCKVISLQLIKINGKKLLEISQK